MSKVVQEVRRVLWLLGSAMCGHIAGGCGLLLVSVAFINHSGLHNPLEFWYRLVTLKGSNLQFEPRLLLHWVLAKGWLPAPSPELSLMWLQWNARNVKMY